MSGIANKYHAGRAPQISHPIPDYVRSLADTAEIANISLATLRRLIALEKGPRVTRLSARRVGVRDSDREAWLNR
jgi:hypothetical protein